MRLRDFSATSHGAWHLGLPPTGPGTSDWLDIWSAEFFRQMVRMIKFA